MMNAVIRGSPKSSSDSARTAIQSQKRNFTQGAGAPDDPKRLFALIANEPFANAENKQDIQQLWNKKPTGLISGHFWNSMVSVNINAGGNPRMKKPLNLTWTGNPD
jgi:hypothetical protein